MIELPRNTTSLDQLPPQSRETIQRLDQIFWDAIPRMKMGRMLKDIHPVGGAEKAEAVKAIAKRIHCTLNNTLYVGDSITDVEAFQLVRGQGGLTLSFNGNEYAVRNAEIAVLSDNAVVTSVLAAVFADSGREGVLNLVEQWGYPALSHICADKTLLQTLSAASLEGLPTVEVVTSENRARLIEESSRFRKTVRGESIGRLG